jgi:hypothetical protein
VQHCDDLQVVCYITRKYSKLYCELPLDLSWPSTEQRGHMRTVRARSISCSNCLPDWSLVQRFGVRELCFKGYVVLNE